MAKRQTTLGKDWNAVCDVCGFTFKASQLKKRWDGVMVCENDWEMRHPQDFIKVPRPEQPVPWSRPEPTPVESSPEYFEGGVQDTTIPQGTFDNRL